MRRTFWMALGAAAGVVVARGLNRAAQALTPTAISTSLAESVRELGDAVRYFAEQVRAGMVEREAELYSVLGVPPAPTRPAASPPPPRRALAAVPPPRTPS